MKQHNIVSGNGHESGQYQSTPGCWGGGSHQRTRGEGRARENSTTTTAMREKVRMEGSAGGGVVCRGTIDGLERDMMSSKWG